MSSNKNIDRAEKKLREIKIKKAINKPFNKNKLNRMMKTMDNVSCRMMTFDILFLFKLGFNSFITKLFGFSVKKIVKLKKKHMIV